MFFSSSTTQTTYPKRNSK